MENYLSCPKLIITISALAFATPFFSQFCYPSSSAAKSTCTSCAEYIVYFQISISYVLICLGDYLLQVDIPKMIVEFVEETKGMMDKVPPHRSYQNDVAEIRVAMDDLVQSSRQHGKRFNVLSGITTLVLRLRAIWTFYGDLFTADYQTENTEEFIAHLARVARARNKLDSINFKGHKYPEDDVRAYI